MRAAGCPDNLWRHDLAGVVALTSVLNDRPAVRRTHNAAHQHPGLRAPDDRAPYGGGPYAGAEPGDDFLWAAAELSLRLDLALHRSATPGSSGSGEGGQP